VDIGADGDIYEIVSDPGDLAAVRAALEGAGVEIQSAEVVQQPTSRVPVEEGDVGQLLRLLEELEADDDVNAVHANFDADAEALERAAAG
jgi:transcriptional/translational regulatory protein YebC/TACO1